jgi:hypothetical protein
MEKVGYIHMYVGIRVDKNTGWATFSVIFPQTRLITLTQIRTYAENS